jgi:hypothetical protein
LTAVPPAPPPPAPPFPSPAPAPAAPAGAEPAAEAVAAEAVAEEAAGARAAVGRPRMEMAACRPTEGSMMRRMEERVLTWRREGERRWGGTCL